MHPSTRRRKLGRPLPGNRGKPKRPKFGEGVRVLAADDSQVNLTLLGESLRKVGCTVTAVPDGESAVNAYGSGTFDVAFLDCQMPIIDGYEVARHIREREQQQGRDRMKIVALTADKSSENEQRCLQSGMDLFCGKPLRPNEVCEILQQCLAH